MDAQERLRRSGAYPTSPNPPPLAAQVKRVIGIPGDVVEVRGGVMLLNGQPRYEPYHPAGVKWCLASTTAARHISPAWLP